MRWSVVVSRQPVEKRPRRRHLVDGPDLTVEDEADCLGREFHGVLLERRRLQEGRVMLLGLREGYRGSRLLPLFIDELLRRAREHGLVGAEASWMIEGELMHRAMEGVGMRVTRRWRIYEGEV